MDDGALYRRFDLLSTKHPRSGERPTQPLKRKTAIFGPNNRCRTWSRGCPCSTAGDEHVFAAVIVERASFEVPEERLELKPRDIEQPQPLVLGRPPQRTGRAVVEREVDPVVTDRVPDCVGDRLVP